MGASNSVIKASERPLDLQARGKGIIQRTAKATTFGAKHDGSHIGTTHLDFVHGEH